MDDKPKKDGNPAWFAGAIILGIYAAFTFKLTGYIFRDTGSFLGLFLIPTLLLVNGVRSYRGKKTYFWRMIAIAFASMLALLILGNVTA